MVYTDTILFPFYFKKACQSQIDDCLYIYLFQFLFVFSIYYGGARLHIGRSLIMVEGLDCTLVEGLLLWWRGWTARWWKVSYYGGGAGLHVGGRSLIMVEGLDCTLVEGLLLWWRGWTAVGGRSLMH